MATPAPPPTPTGTQLPTCTPQNSVLDDFNRANGAVGSNWSGNTSKYDAAGNRLSEAKVLDPLLPAVETAYTYGAARAAPPQHSGGGNLLSGGAYTYTYNTARAASQSAARDNQLTAVSASGSTTGCTRNGLDDRLSQFKNGVTTHYTLDLNAGLTQVLQDGANTYLYGVNRIAQVAETQTGYFLPDASPLAHPQGCGFSQANDRCVR
jgi:hypothetical protein